MWYDQGSVMRGYENNKQAPLVTGYILVTRERKGGGEGSIRLLT